MTTIKRQHCEHSVIDRYGDEEPCGKPSILTFRDWFEGQEYDFPLCKKHAVQRLNYMAKLLHEWEEKHGF